MVLIATVVVCFLCQALRFQKIMFFYVYVLQSNGSDKLYIGYTPNLIRRVKEHNLGLNESTKPYKPWILSFMKPVETVTMQNAEKNILKRVKEG